MQRKLVALATVGAFMSPTAMAQTSNPVTLYGLVFGTLEYVEAKGGGASVPSRVRVEDNSSRFGIRGTEDLGGGLKAFFQLETGFRIDSNVTTFAARNSAVGLQGGWGSFLMGRWDSPYKVAGYPADPWNLLTIAGYWNTIQDNGNFGRRPQNVVQYWTPNFGGFNARVAVTANEGKTATANPRDTSVMVGWAGGPVVINAAWEEHQDQVGATTTAGRKEEGLMLVGAVTIGSLKIAGVAEEIKKTGRTKEKNFYVSAKQRFGKHAIVGTVGTSKDGGANGAAQPESDTFSVAYEYSFTRRTSMHVMYAKVDNNAAGTKNFTLQPVPNTTPGSDPQGVSFGILHTF